MFSSLPFLSFTALSFASAALISPDLLPRTLPSAWHLPSDHPAHDLFRRADSPINFAPVGSPTWSSGFPQSTPDVSKLPSAWLNAYNTALAAGKIPNISQTTNTPGTNPIYPSGSNPFSPEICSATYKCRSPGDVWDAPNGYFLTAFDDGPLPPSTALRQFMSQNQQTTTHFMIGMNILNNPQIFQSVFDGGDDIAVHTWTHPYMTTLSNLDIVAQLGWTSQLIYNSTAGRLPRYWRPPYGDSDNRVRAIAQEVFGLTTVIWNQDTEDWSLTSNGTTPQKIQSSFQQWLTGQKSPGLIILEHELSDASVQAFITAYPLMKSNGWNVASLAQVVGGGQTYQNSQNSSAPVASAQVGPSGSVTPSSASSGSPSQTTTVKSSNVTGNSFGASNTALPTSGALSRINLGWRIWTLLGTFVLAASVL